MPVPRGRDFFLRNFNGRALRIVWHEGETHLAGPSVKLADHALAIVLLVVIDTRVHVGHAEAQGVVEKHGELARRGGNGLGLSGSSAEATVECSQGRMSLADVDRRGA